MAFPREGFVIDYVARILRSSLLHPHLILPTAVLISCAKLEFFPTPIPRFPLLEWLIYTLAALTLLLSATEYLNDGAANNWTPSATINWKDEVIVVTGGSSGIGASLILRLHAERPQSTIAVVDYMPPTWTLPPGARIHFYQCDLSDASLIKDLCHRIRADIGHPTMLINNAGICRGSTVADGSYSDVTLTINTNLVAPFLLCKEFLPEMIRRDHGHIVNVASMSALLPPGKIADYAATKAGLIALHEVVPGCALQLELRHDHPAPRVRLSLAIFSFIKTPLFKGETRQLHFLFPLLDVETVSQAIAGALYSGRSRTIYLPGMMRWVAILRGGPEWMWHLIRDSTKDLGVDFNGSNKSSAWRGSCRL
ncbi:NAD(P)-binding domain protein [Cordyceps fumosorosea ARSEF 2679]|uniref:NAD(P)-binding domain protein n=1 Tax=Cordyceps fumosorosea (strain ARSEF 2679) TaxID=1081104 RepID=A0A167LMC1_CORFA|nr:NAD(P)-binding domain protein [Cordyceps fumosorosea ARSEF 2679]OAA53257.1 NAD(P)-binding domain protein [Cordyceps fumosorosea ARSEF 2679]